MTDNEKYEGISVEERILVVEDDKSIISLVTTALEVHDISFICATNGKSALEIAIREAPSVILLDLGLPDMDGVDVVRTVRSCSMTPIIIVSARGEEDDKIRALDAGADDYLTKPFSVDELLARVRVALRRFRYEKAHAKQAESVFKNGPLRIDYATRNVRVEESELRLAPTEYKLLCLLSLNAGKVLTHKVILEAVWGNSLPQNLPSLRVFMATLRKKLEAVSPKCDCIRTHVGVGYCMVKL